VPGMLPHCVGAYKLSGADLFRTLFGTKEGNVLIIRVSQPCAGRVFGFDGAEHVETTAALGSHKMQDL
jgi:hypothetical protein